MKNIIISLFLLCLIAVGANSQTVVTLINDEAVTDANDTLTSEWIYIGDANYVELFHSVDDTVDIRFYIDYAVGSGRGTYYVTTAIDSIKSTGTASTQVSVGKTLRGFGTSAIVNLIQGANYIRLRSYFQTASEASGIYKAYLNFRD